MFGLFKKTARPDFSAMREQLFGDVSLADWKPLDDHVAGAGPWRHFETARLAVERGDTAAAVAALREVVDSANLETRHYLQAWHALRQLGVQPMPENAKQVLGVVLEVHLEDGLDTLAAYADSSARYINHGGRLIVWGTQDAEIAGLVAALLRAGQGVADFIGPSTEPRRRPPPQSHVRLNMLTASGLHFGEGPIAAIAVDPMGASVLGPGTVLLKALIGRAAATTA
jgi:hypothetical protein